MNIKTYSIPDQQLTIGVADYHDDGPFVAGVPEMLQVLAYEASDNRRERDVLANETPLRAHAHCADEDTFNPATGANVVRDKLIIKDANRYEQKCEIIMSYLDTLREDMMLRMVKNRDRRKAAEARLEALN